MIPGFDPNQLLRFRESANQRFQSSRRGELVACSADEELWLHGIAQESEAISSRFALLRGDGDNGQAKRDERGHVIVVVGGAQPYRGAKGESGEEDWKMKFVLQPLKSDANVVNLSNTIRMLAFAEAGPPEIETQNGKPKVVQRLHRVKYDFVVQGAAKKRMRMAD